MWEGDPPAGAILPLADGCTSTRYLWPGYLGCRTRHVRFRSAIPLSNIGAAASLPIPTHCPLWPSSAQNTEGTAASGRAISDPVGGGHIQPATFHQCETGSTLCWLRLYNFTATPNLPSAWKLVSEATLSATGGKSDLACESRQVGVGFGCPLETAC